MDIDLATLERLLALCQRYRITRLRSKDLDIEIAPHPVREVVYGGNSKPGDDKADAISDDVLFHSSG